MISKEELQGLAELARLEVGEAEAASLQKDISNILEYVGAVSAQMPQGEAPRRGQNLLHNVMREDTLRAAGDVLAGKEEALRAAFPAREGDYNVVRKIIQKDE